MGAKFSSNEYLASHSNNRKFEENYDYQDFSANRRNLLHCELVTYAYLYFVQMHQFLST